MASAAPPVLMLLLLGLLLGPQGAARSPEPAAALKTLPPLPSSFDEVYGKQMLYMAWSAFCNRTELMTWTCMWCGYNPDFVCDGFAENATTGGQGYVAHSEAAQTIVIGFRGSADFINTIYDIDPWRVRPYKNVTDALVHAGFEDCYESVAIELRPIVARLVDTLNITTIVATGHSLGAAMAGLAALDMRLMLGKKVPRIAMINMGMPRTGNRAWSDFYATQSIETWRAVHYHDIVPHLPFRYFPIEGGYYHVPGEVWEFNNTDSLDWKVCSLTDGEDPSCADSVPVYKWWPPDHLNYFGVQQNNCDH